MQNKSERGQNNFGNFENVVNIYHSERTFTYRPTEIKILLPKPLKTSVLLNIKELIMGKSRLGPF
jgi:hypothetical protein